MIEATILIPLADNSGHEFSATHHRAFETLLIELFGGLSRLPGETLGAWVDGGTRYDDKLISYLVALPSITDGGKLGEAVSFAKQHYRQEAIFLRYLGVAEII